MKSVPASKLFCAPHWFQTRPELRRAVWREYSNGQERTKTPSMRYLAVQRLAVAELAFKPHDEQAAAVAGGIILQGERFRRRAIENGQGDPWVGLLKPELLQAMEVPA